MYLITIGLKILEKLLALLDTALNMLKQKIGMENEQLEIQRNTKDSNKRTIYQYFIGFTNSYNDISILDLLKKIRTKIEENESANEICKFINSYHSDEDKGIHYIEHHINYAIQWSGKKIAKKLNETFIKNKIEDCIKDGKWKYKRKWNLNKISYSQILLNNVNELIRMIEQKDYE